VVFGLLPSIGASSGNVATALRAGGRGTRAQASSSRVKRVIVATEVALAITLMAGAGLLLRSFGNLMSVDVGFRPQGVLSAQLRLPDARYDSLPAQRLFVESLAERLRALPGVAKAGLINLMPLDGDDFDLSFTICGRPAVRPSDQPDAQVRTITPGLFDAMGIPVLRGRDVQPSDRAGTPQIVLVNRAFAAKYFPHADPLTQNLILGWSINGTRMGGDVVGVVGDIRGAELSSEPAPTIYLPMAQSAANAIGIVVRSNVAPSSLVPSVRSVVRGLDQLIALFDVQTMQDRLVQSVGAQRFYATLVATFAAVALLLSAVGLYGVIAYTVTQRTHEMGIRVALGATASRISRMVVVEGLTLTVIGATVGIVCAYFAARVIASLLYGIGSSDPVTFIGAVLALCAVAALASYLPARRAAAVDPLIAMRGD
jgi:putative ABC transport system permease protein